MMHLYDTRTVRDMLLVAVLCVLTIVAINALLTVVSAAFPNWLPRQFMGVDFIADNRNRAAAVNALYRDGQLGGSDPVVVILGLSSASEGVSLHDLDKKISHEARLLGLSGGGRNMRDITRYTEPLLAGSARPALVIFAINPFHLMDTPPVTTAFIDNLRKSETLDDLRGYWLVNRRQDVKYAIDAGLDRSRSVAFESLDVRLHEGGDPWREILRMGLAPATHEVQWQSNVQRYGERGYYELANYTRSAKQIEILQSLITGFQDRDAEVVLVWMPEHSRLRAAIPDAAVTTITTTLAQGFGARMPQIIDLRSALTDSGFTDISHMNAAGREQFSPILAELLQQKLAKRGKIYDKTGK